VVIVWYLFFLATLLTAGMLALNSWRWVEAKNVQSNNTDADALAAAAVLASDLLLYGDEADIYDGAGADLLADAIAMAKTWAANNSVDGAAFSLLDEDILFGHQELTPTRTFTSIDYTKATPAELRTINAVQIVGKRTVERGNPVPVFGAAYVGSAYAQVVTRSTAVLDRYVVGFDSSGPLIVSPLCPLAVFSDSTGADTNSWENQVEGPATPPPASGKIPYGTLTVNVHHSAISGVTPNAALLKIGTASFADLCTQMENGVTAGEFTAFETAAGTQFLLDAATNQLMIDHHAGPAPASSDFTDLVDTLQKVEAAGACRVFPVYTSYDTMTGKVTLTQFVAAKVTDVATKTDAMMNAYITFKLTPCLLATPTALTDPSRDATFVAPSRPLVNRYVCRVRMAD
jgi:hypothetical protein